MPVAESAFFLMFIMFLGSAGAALVFGVLMALFWLMTPARTFLKARLRHKPIVAAFRRDGKIDFALSTEYIQGLVRTKDYGSFIIDEDGAYSEKKSGVVLLLACAEHGITKSPGWLELIGAMKFGKFDCVTDAKAADALYHKCEDCGYTGYMSMVLDDDDVPVMDDNGNVKYECPNLLDKEAEDVRKEEETGTTGSEGNEPLRES